MWYTDMAYEVLLCKNNKISVKRRNAMGERLYNNIMLPDEWPPKYSEETLRNKLPVPYLDTPPDIIDITVGRQLFVDDFLIEVHNLYPVCHKAKKFEGNPVFKPETSMEKYERLPCAAPKSGGVWWDKDEKIMKMWYEAGWLHKMGYATSKDGIHWERPNLGIVGDTNEILPERGAPAEDGRIRQFRPDSTTVFIDYDTDKPDERYKLFMRSPGLDRPGIAAVSADGIHWDKARYTVTQGDRSTMFYNPFRKKWVYSIRCSWSGLRSREYAECDDYLEGTDWTGKNVKWLCADSTDKPNAYLRVKPELYNVDCVAYESIMLGMFQIYYGPNNNVGFETGAPKITELVAMYSRDGFHFSRPTNETFINASMVRGEWDRGYVQSVGGLCTVHDDELWFYYIGFAGDEAGGGKGNPNDCQFDTMYANGATGIAKLRRDGFVSLGTENDGEIITRKLTFTGRKKHFFINAETEGNGGIYVKILSADKKTVLAESAPFTGDSTHAELDFDGFDLSSLEGEAFRLHFYVTSGKIYSFWFSTSENGESGGYDAAGNVNA